MTAPCPTCQTGTNRCTEGDRLWDQCNRAYFQQGFNRYIAMVEEYTLHVDGSGFYCSDCNRPHREAEGCEQ